MLKLFFLIKRNLGGSNQPGCEEDMIPSVCFHSRSWQLYQESVRCKNAFIAIKCDSFQQFIKNSEKNECWPDTALMGYEASKELRGNYYLRTHRNVYKLSLGKQSLNMSYTLVCYGPQTPDNCRLIPEFADKS